MRILVTALTLLAAALPAQTEEPIDPARAARILEALALADRQDIASPEIAAIEERIAAETDPEVRLALVTSLRHLDAMTDAARAEATALALDDEQDGSFRRQAISALGGEGWSMAEADVERLREDPLLTAYAQDVLFPMQVFAYAIPIEPPVRDGCTILLHGSFSSSGRSAWWLHESGFAHHLNGWVGNVWRVIADEGTRIVDLDPFGWPSSTPTTSSITEAGALVAGHLREILRSAPPPIDIIAHSHGGNVVVRALAETVATDPDLRVRNLIMLGTPHVFDDGELIHWPQDRSHPLYDCYERIINIHSPEDMVATTLAGVLAVGGSTRTLGPEGIPRVTDIFLHTDVGRFDAHRVLHSNTMAHALGQAMIGDLNWSAEVFPEITDSDDVGAAR